MKNYRNTDPETSKIAGELVINRAQSQRYLLLWYYQEMDDCTDDEVAFAADMLDGNHYTKRCSELRSEGLIEVLRDEDGKIVTRMGLGGRQRMICRITPKGRQMLGERIKQGLKVPKEA